MGYVPVKSAPAALRPGTMLKVNSDDSCSWSQVTFVVVENMQVTPGQVAGSPAAFPPTQQHGAYQQPGFAVSASGHQQQPPSLMTSPPPRRDYSRQMITLNSIQIANTVLNVSFGIAEIFLRSLIAYIGVSIWAPLCVSFCFISMRNRLGRVDALFFPAAFLCSLSSCYVNVWISAKRFQSITVPLFSSSMV